MFENSSSLNKIRSSLIVSVVTLSVFFTQFIFRSHDDNTLTRWAWTFADVNIIRIFLFLFLGIIIAYAFSKFSFPERYPAIFLFLSSIGIGALFWSEPEVIIDASRYFTQAKHLELYGVKYFIQEWGRGINAWTDLPLIPFLYGLIFKFLGESRLSIQIFTTFLFSTTLVLTCKTGKILWDEETGLIAGVSLLGMPYLFTQVPIMLIDVPTMFFFMLSIYTFIRALNEGGVGMITFSAIALFLAFFSKYSIWLMLSVLLVIYIVYIMNKSGNRKRYVFRGGLVALIAGLLIGIAILAKFGVISGQIKFLQEYQMPGLKQWGESFISTFLFQIHPFITVAALYSFYVAFKKRDFKYAIISWLIILVFIVQIRRIRYIIMVFPLLALMASYGLQQIRDKGMRRFIIGSAIASSLVVAIFTYLPYLEKLSAVNMKNAGQYLNSLEIEKVEVFTPPQTMPIVNPAINVPILDLSTDKKITYNYEQPLLTQWARHTRVRFTWEYKNPEYYSMDIKDSEKADAVVVISDSADPPLPDYLRQRVEGYHVSRVFRTGAEMSYTTVVIVYEKISDANSSRSATLESASSNGVF